MENHLPELRMEDLIHILDTMKVGIIITDREGTVLWGNQYYSDLAKFHISDYFGRNVREIPKRENVTLPEHKTLFDTVLQKNAEIHEVVKYNTNDYVITTVAPVIDTSGQPTFFSTPSPTTARPSECRRSCPSPTPAPAPWRSSCWSCSSASSWEISW